MKDYTDEELSSISMLATKQKLLEFSISEKEKDIELLKEKLKQVSEVDLPNAMAEIGMSSFTLDDGRKITVKKEVYGSIPKDNPGPALNWLREHNYGSLIKNVISVEFGKGEDDNAIEAGMLLAQAGFKPNQQETVHPSTLKAFLKEQIESGSDIPLELFKAFVVDKSKISKEK